MMHIARTMRSLNQLLSYPGEHTVEAAELLYIILQADLPEAARNISRFGAYLEQHDRATVEEAFTGTFDVTPARALEVGWHLFGEEYARGLFLVRMREELRKFGLPESTELPDHITHVLSIISSMPTDAATRFATACVLPAVTRMLRGFDDSDSPYRDVIAAMELILQHLWGGGHRQSTESQVPQSDAAAQQPNVDLLHAIPVADIDFNGCGGDCGCGSAAPAGEFVELSTDRRSHGSDQS